MPPDSWVPKREMPLRPFTYWMATPVGDLQLPRWAVGRLGPRYLIQCETEEQIQDLVDALNAQDRP